MSSEADAQEAEFNRLRIGLFDRALRLRLDSKKTKEE